jgi:transcriptional regulator with XRE-family HTH domain
MQSSRLLALAVDWWIEYRDVDPVRRAFRLTDVEYWHRLIEKTLEKNKELHRNPSTWTALADKLGRNISNIYRIFTSGESKPSIDDLRSIASILGLPVTDFLMNDRDRNAKAAKILCREKVELFEITAYVVYRQTGPTVEDGQLDPRCLRELIGFVQQISTVQSAESSVWKVARCLESSLKEAQNNSLKKRERGF